jgi:hypothetical protein
MRRYQKDPAVYSRTDKDISYVLKSGGTHLFELNETATLLWDMLKKPHTQVDLEKKLCSVFKISQEIASVDVSNFLTSCLREHLLQEVK